MKPTEEDIRVLAYFETEECKRTRRPIPPTLAKLAAEAPPRDQMTKQTMFYGWLANVGQGQYALTLAGRSKLERVLEGRATPEEKTKTPF